ncbi:helix-turn-helix domain-containing protein [Gaetbulibacter sp. PBL-D1]|uniref:helix-turn-helix domain-containing protein n=1 Tax=Gaetbulibacter sp. PBL-D1 TaxID=3422594 RepID=UPI003D2F4619
MEAVILTAEQYNNLVSRLDELKTSLESNQKPSHEVFLDNQEFIQLMHISKRTAQTWRDEGKISFSQIGSKIYYKMKDVEVLLNKNYNKAFKNKR